MSSSSSSTMASLSSCCASAAPAAAARGARASLCLPRVEAGTGLRSSPVLWQQRWNPLGNSRRVRRGAVVRAHLGQLPDPGQVDAVAGFLAHGGSVQHVLSRLEGVLYTLADATVAADAAIEKDDGGWLGGLTNALEYVLKFLKDGLASLNVPYSYGFAIILLTILVKAATYPLTKQQVESTLAMQNLQPKLKAIQQRYAGDQERIQLETARLYKQAGVNPLAGCLPTLATLPVWIGLYRALSNVANEGLLTEGFFWIPSLAGPTTLLTRESGSGISWLFPFVDGHPPLGWPDTIAYLVLPVLLVASQFASMQMMQPPTTDESQKNTQLILKFLPLMIGYFSLSVPSGLSLYWFTNNLLSTAQQVWLRNLGGAKPVVGKDGAGIISAGQAKRSSPSASALPAAATAAPEVKEEKEKRGEKFKRLKEEELKRKEAARVAAEQASAAAAAAASKAAAEERERERERLAKEKLATAEVPESKPSSDEEEEEGEEDDSTPDVAAAKDSLEGAYASNGTAAAGSYPTAPAKKSKRSKRKRTV